MDEKFKCRAFILLALRVLIDLAVSSIIYYQTDSPINGIAVMLGCSVFSYILGLGISKEKFWGRYGHRVYLSDAPLSYWFIVAFLIISHLVVTGLMVRLIKW